MAACTLPMQPNVRILHQEMNTDSPRYQGRQNADALMYPPTPTYDTHTDTHQAGSHSWPVDSVSMDQLQGKSLWHSDRQDWGPQGLQSLSLYFKLRLSVSVCRWLHNKSLACNGHRWTGGHDPKLRSHIVGWTPFSLQKQDQETDRVPSFSS